MENKELCPNCKNKHMWKNFKIFEIPKKKNKLLKMNKFILKRLQMFYIFWTDVLKWQYIKCWAKRLCTYFYEDSSLKLKKNISTMRLTQKNTMLIKNRIYFLLHQHVQIFWYGGMLTNKYCKAGVRKRTSLRSWFVKPVWWNEKIFKTS